MEEFVQTENEDTETNQKVHSAMDDTFPTFANGLVADIAFYSIDVELHLVFARRNKVNLWNDDFYTLNPEQQLSNFLMEYICSIIVPRDIQVLTLEANFILENSDSDTCRIIFTKNKVLLPLLENNHWVLLIIDFEQKTFACLNSLPHLFLGYDDFFIRFLDFIENRSRKLNLLDNTDGWKEKYYDIDHQKDGYNCGVFVVDYIKQYVETKTVSKRNLCADTFRDEIKLLCIKGSDDMRGACLHCGQHSLESLQCRRCKRRIQCSSCKRSMQRGINIASFKRRGDICPLCYKYQIIFGTTNGPSRVEK